MTKKKVKLILLRMGYVESCATSVMTFFNADGFGTVEEALRDIGDVIVPKGIELR